MRSGKRNTWTKRCRLQKWLLYGAYGYTGKMIAEEAARRHIAPILAGRDARKLDEIAEWLDCRRRVFDLDSEKSAIAGQLEGVDVVLNCAGPFSSTAVPMMEACIEAGVDYLDITGEIDTIENAAARSGRAKAAGVSLMPAVGCDVVPSDCLALRLARRLPDACRLELAFGGKLHFGAAFGTNAANLCRQRWSRLVRIG